MFAHHFAVIFFHPFYSMFIFQITPVFENDNKSLTLYFLAIMLNKTGWLCGSGFRG
jgi:hypothetical protein